MGCYCLRLALENLSVSGVAPEFANLRGTIHGWLLSWRAHPQLVMSSTLFSIIKLINSFTHRQNSVVSIVKGTVGSRSFASVIWNHFPPFGTISTIYHPTFVQCRMVKLHQTVASAPPPPGCKCVCTFRPVCMCHDSALSCSLLRWSPAKR